MASTPPPFEARALLPSRCMVDHPAPESDEIARLRPPGAPIWDAHTHLGDDEDGMSLRPDRLLRLFDRADVAGGCVFALHDPARVPGYRVPNDRVLDWAAENPDRLVPFCRVDPDDDPLTEIDRCHQRGARGIKLHPRAQEFDFTHGTLAAIFSRAHDENLPILIHAGRGMAPIADRLCDLALEYPAPLILAHAGIADQGIFCARLQDHPRVVFDTSVFAPIDLGELMARVPAERIVFASDPPYGRPHLALYALLRMARASGATDDQLTAMLGGTVRALLDGVALPSPRPPIRERSTPVPGAIARLSPLLYFAVATVTRGSLTGVDGALEMAASICRDPDPGVAGPTLERIAQRLAEIAAARRTRDRFPADLLYLALADAASPEVDAAA